ncbi:chromatin remodeling Snf/Swi complex subunit [Fusarium oxysporum]|nr:chromatin remodeling Snf/Swi complex subunit [Fusarium oxysporum]
MERLRANNTTLGTGWGVGSMGAINNNIPSLTSFAEENNYQYGYSGSSAGMNGRSLTYAQQQLNKQRQDFERVRLRPEQLSNIIHDERHDIVPIQPFEELYKLERRI